MSSLLYEQSRNGRSLLVSSQEELNAIHTGLLARTNERLGETETAEELKLTAQETLVMRTYYHSKIRDICQALDFSMAVAADAHIFLHRYFIRFGPLEHDLKHTM